MIEALPLVNIGAGGLVTLVVLLMLTDKLIWHTRLKNAEKDRDRWQGIALRALGVAEKMTTQGEVTTAIVASLPDPAAEEQQP